MASPGDPTGELDIADAHRALAARLFNRTWELLDIAERASSEDEEMLAATFGQRYHWYQVGTPLNKAIADWQVSRVASVLGLPDLGLRFGVLSLRLCEAHELGPFYRAYAHEAIARAADVLNDVAARDRHVLAARELVHLIQDPDQQRMIEADVSMMVWE